MSSFCWAEVIFLFSAHDFHYVQLFLLVIDQIFIPFSQSDLILMWTIVIFFSLSFKFTKRNGLTQKSSLLGDKVFGSGAPSHMRIQELVLTKFWQIHWPCSNQGGGGRQIMSNHIDLSYPSFESRPLSCSCKHYRLFSTVSIMI